MLNEVSSPDRDLSTFYTSSSQPLLEAHIVNKKDIFYTKGRNLAKNIYREVWNTENLIDGNDYGIVVSQNSNVVGNLNIQLKQSGKSLKSENFFGKKHWCNYFKGTDNQVAEVSALALAQDAPTELRRPIIMMLIMAVQSLCRLEEINFLVTIQHDYLLRILTKSLHLPFFQNQVIRQPQDNVPNDNYWNRVKSPSLYYVQPLSSEFIESCYSFFSYLNMSGIKTAFYPRAKSSEALSYAAFRSLWNQDKASNLISS
jgi:hypothetical protein